MRKLTALLLVAVPLLGAAQQTAQPPPEAPPQQVAPPAGQPPAPPQAVQQQGQDVPPPPQGPYAPPPQYAPPPPPQGQYAPAPQYAPPPPQGPYAPPPQYAPQAQPQPMPYQRPFKQRDTWYIGFGLGGGSGRIKDSDGSASFKEFLGTGKSPTNVSLNFKLGATLTPRLLLGGDISAISSQSKDAFGNNRSVGITNVDAVLTFFPMERGLFLRAGLGLSSLQHTRETAVGTVSDSFSGGNVLAGIGYAFWLGRQFNLTLNLDVSAQNYNTSDQGAPDSSSFSTLWLGFDWY